MALRISAAFDAFLTAHRRLHMYKLQFFVSHGQMFVTTYFTPTCGLLHLFCLKQMRNKRLETYLSVRSLTKLHNLQKIIMQCKINKNTCYGISNDENEIALFRQSSNASTRYLQFSAAVLLLQVCFLEVSNNNNLI